MKVIDFIKVCRGNVRFRFDTEEPLIDRQDALKGCWDKGILEREVATVTFSVDYKGTSSTVYDGPPSPQGEGLEVPRHTSVSLTREGCAAVICEISTVYEDNVQA